MSTEEEHNGEVYSTSKRKLSETNESLINKLLEDEQKQRECTSAPAVCIVVVIHLDRLLTFLHFQRYFTYIVLYTSLQECLINRSNIMRPQAALLICRYIKVKE